MIKWKLYKHEEKRCQTKKKKKKQITPLDKGGRQDHEPYDWISSMPFLSSSNFLLFSLDLSLYEFIRTLDDL